MTNDEIDKIEEDWKKHNYILVPRLCVALRESMALVRQTEAKFADKEAECIMLFNQSASYEARLRQSEKQDI